jgi:lycopene cyclase domain-containing protein
MFWDVMGTFQIFFRREKEKNSMSFLYLLVNLFSILPPLILSFHPTLKLNKRWKFIFPAILINASIFILFDMWYTSISIWGFNPKYIIGLKIGGLPIEEILFFICIPYACIFSYHCLNTLVKKDYFEKYQNAISITLLFFLAIGTVYYHTNVYTLFAFGTSFILIALLHFAFKVKWLSRFYFAYLILQIPFLIVNGILTGTGLKEPIVWYNERHIIGLRIGTIPFEDIFYGMSMLLLFFALYEYFLSRKSNLNQA